MRIPPWLLAPFLCVLALPLCAAERLDAHQVFRRLQPALGYLDFVWAQAEGDLNGDGIPDVAMLLTGSRDEAAGREERVVVLAGTPDGGYRVLSLSGDFCHPSKFYELDIQRGALLIGMAETADGRQ